MRPYIKFIFFILCIVTSELAAFLDLDTMVQPFVMEAKQIHIPGYPDAFNPSIVKWDNRLLMSFRARDPKTRLANLVGFVWLDKNFVPLGPPRLLEIGKGEPQTSYIQDPRLYVVNGKLYMSYSDIRPEITTHIEKRQMCVAEIEHDGVHFTAKGCDCFLDFQGDRNNKFEKNWVPFDYQAIMLLSYSLSPHKVFLPLLGESRCVTVAHSHEFNAWQWGELRGGTPALMVGNSYLAFFHSSTYIATVQSEKKRMAHYFMGAYLFEKEPPFAIKKISPQPIVSPKFYNGMAHKTWKPLQVIFPCSYIHNKDYIWISYGRQDHEAWVIKLDKAGLLKSLISFGN